MKKPKVVVAKVLEEYSNKMESTQDKELLKEFLKAIKKANKPAIQDLWLTQESSISYWLLIIDALDNKSHMKMAEELLIWKEFLARDDAMVRCVQSSEHKIYQLCVKRFDIDSAPVLIVSTDPIFNDYIQINSGVVSELAKSDLMIRDLASKIHNQIFRGISLEKINKQMGKEEFWKKFNVVYKEIKSFISISINTETNVSD